MLGSLRDLSPIVAVILFFQFFVLRQPLPDVAQLLTGLSFVILGLTFFIHGLEQGLFPIGESMAHAFTGKGSIVWLVIFVFALGLGLSETVPGRNPLIDGFGLIAFASLFPIISVMAYAQLSELKAKYGAKASD